MRGSFNRSGEQKALQLVSAWASQHRLVLGQVKVEENSNEITAIPGLLNLLEIAGCIITIALATKDVVNATDANRLAYSQ